MLASSSVLSSLSTLDSLPDMQQSQKVNEADRKETLLTKILSDRKSSAMTIASKLKSIYTHKVLTKSAILTYSIVALRVSATTLITATVKAHLQRKRMENYLSKLHCSYKITTCIDNSSHIKMVVYLGNSIEKEFDFEYDTYSGKHVLFIPRNSVTDSVYKFNFISGGKIIIDSSYASVNEREKYMNVINFTQIKKDEEEKLKSDRISLRYIMCLMRRRKDEPLGSSGNVTNDDEEEIDDRDKDIAYSRLAKKMSSSCIKTVFHKSLTISRGKKIDFDYLPLERPKSILKNLRRDSNNSLLNRKKVSFKKKVEYSI